MDRDDPIYPRRWILWWQGSGPKRGTHVMELTARDMSYAREIAYLGAGGENAQQDGLHDQAEIMVREHNLIVDRLRAALIFSDTPIAADGNRQ